MSTVQQPAEMGERTFVRWSYALLLILLLAVVGLLAYARGEPGDDGRTPDAPAVEESTSKGLGDG